MTLQRILEPEVMDSDEEALDYDAMDHAAVNIAFCEDLMAQTEDLDPTLDVGTGTARIPIELCRRASRARVVGIDLAESMLRLARQNVASADLVTRITIELQDAKTLSYAPGSFRCAVSNTIFHHIPDPVPALREMIRVLGPGGLLFVRDLIRPETEAEVRALCERYALGESSRQRALLQDSLHASFTIEEVRRMVEECGLPKAAVRQTSDRHWTLAHRLGGQRA
jgi:ubiquinone/menaquinone biosynthesis C-methylase UbiE